jgi:hypothetical protein
VGSGFRRETQQLQEHRWYQARRLRHLNPRIRGIQGYPAYLQDQVDLWCRRGLVPLHRPCPVCPGCRKYPWLLAPRVHPAEGGWGGGTGAGGGWRGGVESGWSGVNVSSVDGFGYSVGCGLRIEG